MEPAENMVGRPEGLEIDDSKTGRIAARGLKPQPGARLVRSFAEARAILRSDMMLQAGVGGDITVDASQQSVFFLDGELHRRPARGDRPVLHTQGDFEPLPRGDGKLDGRTDRPAASGRPCPA